MTGSAAAPRLLARLYALLTRPLAEDEERVAFWLRHVQLGVVLSEVGVLVVLAYGLHRGGSTGLQLCLVAAAVGLITPAVLLLPVGRIVRSRHGSAFFYAWSGGLLSTICATAVIDGGAESPLVLLLFIPLTYVALAYPPAGVALTGLLLVVAYLGIALTGPPPIEQLLVMTTTLGIFTAMSTWVSTNQWRLYDRQQLLAARLTLLAQVDPLTGALNRGALRARLEGLVTRCCATEPVTVCVLDLDGFKSVNDAHGHRAGDDVLVAVTAALQGAARADDVVGRLGGDEFAVLLPGVTGHVAADLVQRLVSAVAAAGAASGVTASAGQATATHPLADVDALLEVADGRMYTVKVAARAARASRTLPTQSAR